MNLPFIETDNETQQELEGLLSKMIEESENSYPMKSEILQGYLKIFMIYISRKMTLRIQEVTLDNDCEIVRKFIALVKAHFTTKKFVSDYAGRPLCVTELSKFCYQKNNRLSCKLSHTSIHSVGG